MRDKVIEIIKTMRGQAAIDDALTVAEREFKCPPKAMRKFDGLRGEVK